MAIAAVSLSAVGMQGSAQADISVTPGTAPATSASAMSLLAVAQTPSPVAPIVSFTGNVTLSVDGVGTLNSSAQVEVEKTPGSSVRAAYLAAASTGFTNYIPVDGDVAVGSSPVAWDSTRTMSNTIGSYNVWADVTSLVKSAIDSAPAGRVSIDISEANPGLLDGEILAVVFDDPAAPTSTVVVAYGAQQVTGDRITIGNAPTGTPQVTLGLGISFGFQSAGQYSTVDVNGVRLTSAAGGQDDGQSANGALITVGGLDDSRENPSLPDATDNQSGCPRCDDELYSLDAFASQGPSTLVLQTANPSADDNLFFASLEIRGAAGGWTPGGTPTGPEGTRIAPYDVDGNGAVRVAALGDSFASGEGLLPNWPSARYDCGTDLPKVDQGYVRDTNVRRRFVSAASHAWTIGNCTILNNSAVEPTGAWWTADAVNTENKCHRSGLAYGPRIWSALGTTGSNGLFDACSGAKVKNVGLDPQTAPAAQYPLSPFGVFGGRTQGADLADYEKSGAPDVLFISLGGNDLGTNAGVSEVIKQCVVSGCNRTALLNRITQVIEPALSRTYGGLRAQLPPSTMVWIIGYPKIFGQFDRCLSGGVALRSSDRDWIDLTLIPRLNDAARRSAQKEGFGFINPYNLAAGHEACALTDAWINGIRSPLEASFHPNQRWHSALTDAFLATHTYRDRWICFPDCNGVAGG